MASLSPEEQREKLEHIARLARRDSDKLLRGLVRNDSEAVLEVLFDLHGLGNAAMSWLDDDGESVREALA